MDKLNYIERLKDKLHGTDYIALKYAEGRHCGKYGNWQDERQAIRDEINLVRAMTDEEFEEYWREKENEYSDGTN